ncbi:ATP-dependent DNA ligase [Streptomyces werraensis]|uniref:ATP-dependent DNA ligase n=1 Tax=Streptomyces werraensis TaxID=68284 RepID=UPI0036C3838F
MVSIPPVQPMLAETRSELPPARAPPGGLAFEQKPDGYRAVLLARPAGRVHLRSRNSTDLQPRVPEIAAAGRALRAPLVLDGELVVAAERRLDCGWFQLPRRTSHSSLSYCVVALSGTCPEQAAELPGQSVAVRDIDQRLPNVVATFESQMRTRDAHSDVSETRVQLVTVPESLEELDA